MDLERIVPTQTPPPKFRYTPCVRIGSRAVVSGMVGINPATGQLHEGGVAAQTRQIFDNLRLMMREQGASLSDLVIARVYLHRFSDFTAFNAEWEAQFEGLHVPARSTMGVHGLPLNADIEIEFEWHQSEGAIATSKE